MPMMPGTGSSGRAEALYGLTGDRSYDVEILIEVQDREPGQFRRRGDDQVWHRGSTVLAPVGELAFGEPELLKMTVAAAELYPGFVAELEEASGIPTGYQRGGALHVALDRDEAAELRRGAWRVASWWAGRGGARPAPT